MSSLVDLLGISSSCALFVVPHSVPFLVQVPQWPPGSLVSPSVFSAGLLLQILVCFDSCINLQPRCSLPHSPAATPLCLVFALLGKIAHSFLSVKLTTNFASLLKYSLPLQTPLISPCSFLAAACSFPSEFFSFYWNVYLMEVSLLPQCFPRCTAVSSFTHRSALCKQPH